MRQILPFVNLNGKIVNQKSAQISIFNEGFMSGLGVFTTIKVREGVPLFLERHLNRLKTSAQQLGQLRAFSLQLLALKGAIYSAIKKNQLTNGGLRVTITPDNILIHTFTIKQFNNLAMKQFSNETIKVIALPDPRDIYKTIKTTYRLPHILAQKQAQSKGAQDALFTQNNELIESTNANIFSCASANSQLSAKSYRLSITTPPIKGRGLNGITRQILMENLPVREQNIPANTTNPLILINSLSLRIVESIDGRKIDQNPEFVNLIRQALDVAEKNYIANNSRFY